MIIALLLTLAGFASAQTGNPPPHIITMALLHSYNGGGDVTAAEAAPYLSWASNPGGSYLSTITGAGIKAYTYLDSDVEYSCKGCSPLWNTLKAHPQYISMNCSNEINHYPWNQKGELVDITKTGWWPFWAAEMNAEWTDESPAAWTAMFADDATAWGNEKRNPCGVSDSSYTASLITMFSTVTMPIIFNGLGSGTPAIENGLYSVSNVIGGMNEVCFVDYSGNPVTDKSGVWTTTENNELYAASVQKSFFCLSGGGPAASEVLARTYVYASLMLTYDVATTALFEQFVPNGGTGGLTVFPETGLVPTNPVVAQPASIAALNINGLYGREYLDCYYQGVDLGKCAAVVNSNASFSYPFPYSGYGHTMTLTGGGVLEGGAASFNGSAPPLTMDPASAIIVFP